MNKTVESLFLFQLKFPTVILEPGIRGPFFPDLNEKSWTWKQIEYAYFAQSIILFISALLTDQSDLRIQFRITNENPGFQLHY